MAGHTPDAVRALIGTETGVSDWVTITQDMVDQFAAVTRDPVTIHTDPASARAAGLDGTIAHGLLTLSMLGGFVTGALPVLHAVAIGYNYGFDKVRFMSPVRTGSRLRGRFVLRAFDERSPGRWVATMDVTMEIEGEPKPALVAEWLGMQIIG